MYLTMLRGIVCLPVLFVCVAAADAIFVVEGKPRAVRSFGQPWQQGDGYLECTGEGNYLFGLKTVGPGDFRIVARLSLERVDGTAASLLIGENHFGFDGRGKKLFVEGPVFGETRLLDSTESSITAGNPFDVVLARKGKVLTVAIGGRKVFEGEFALDPIPSIALRPWRSTMRVYRFAASGTIRAAARTGMQAKGRLVEHVTIGDRTLSVAALPEGLLLRENLGLVCVSDLVGQVVHVSRANLFETRATITPGGDYLLMFPEGRHYGGTGNIHKKVNTLIAYRSKDKGKTWIGPSAAFDIPYSQHGFIPLVPRGSKRLYAFGTQPVPKEREGSENCPIGFRYSDDDGYTWSKVTLIRPTNDPGFKGMSVMRMTETERGTWLLGSHEADWTTKPLTTRAYVLRSEDRGITWTLHPGPRPAGWFEPRHNRMDEPRPVALAGGEALILARTCEGHLWEIRSKDDGRSWSTPRFLFANALARRLRAVRGTTTSAPISTYSSTATPRTSSCRTAGNEPST